MLVGSFDGMLVGSFDIDGMLVGSFNGSIGLQIGVTVSLADPVENELKYTCTPTSDSIFKHPCGKLDKANAEPHSHCSAVAADLHSVSVPRKTEPAGHTFVPCVPSTNPTTTSPTSMNGWMDESVSTHRR